MTAYIVAQIAVHDRERYDRYAAAFLPTLKPFGGRLLAADAHAEVLEGDWGFGKLNIIAFADRETALAWAASPAYQAIAPDRLAASDGLVLLASGFG
jgi:uncharacterized protein (DUF1330 family)